jgi:Ca2+-binding EF-hand superfamily protein
MRRIIATYSREINYDHFTKIYESLTSHGEDMVSESFKALDRAGNGFLTYEDFDELCNVHLRHVP